MPLPVRKELRELFAEPALASRSAVPRPLISLATLATSLGCGLAALLPLAEHGLLRMHSVPPLSGASLVEPVPEAALLWLRGWLLPAQAKPLLSAGDLAALLEVTPATVASLAAEHDVPVTWDRALGGIVLSVWAARKLVLAMLGGAGAGAAASDEAARFDRQALLGWLLAGDPEAILAQPPLSYSAALEKEIERVAGLTEPTRSMRAAALVQQFDEARRVFEAGQAGRVPASSPGSRPCVPLDPDVPADEHAAVRFGRRFSRLRLSPARAARGDQR